MNFRRLVPVGGLLHLLLLLSAGPLAGQGALLDARMNVSLPSPGEDIRVEIRYRVLPEPGGAEIPLSVLVIESAGLLSLQAFVDGAEVEQPGGGESAFRLQEVRDHFFEGTIQLPTSVTVEGKPLSLEFRYLVTGAWTEKGRAVLPLVVPRWIPSLPDPRTFLAAVEPPTGYSITESFPTSVLARPAPAPSPHGSAPEGSYQIGLQGVPAMLILRVAEGEGPVLNLERGLDLLVVGILLLMGALGVGYLRRASR